MLIDFSKIILTLEGVPYKHHEKHQEKDRIVDLTLAHVSMFSLDYVDPKEPAPPPSEGYIRGKIIHDINKATCAIELTEDEIKILSDVIKKTWRPHIIFQSCEALGVKA